jgi:hypothetical protein
VDDLTLEEADHRLDNGVVVASDSAAFLISVP